MTSVDLIFRNGNIFDGTRHRLRQAVAVSQGRVVAVVDESAAADLVGGGTTVVDLAGGLLLPGFQDAHVHPVQGGLERIRVTCRHSTLVRSTSPQWPTTPGRNGTRSGSAEAGGRCLPSRPQVQGQPTSTPWWVTDPSSCRTATITAPG